MVPPDMDPDTSEGRPPRLRIVDEEERAPLPDLPASPLGPLPAQVAFEQIVFGADLTNAYTAFRVASAARSLLGVALDLRRSAVRHAPHAFLRGITPGEKSAEAAEAVVRAHLHEAFAGVARPADLRKIALRASDEISASRRITASVGLDTDDLCEAHLREASTGLGAAQTIAPPYLRDLSVSIGQGIPTPSEPRSGPRLGDILAGVFGGVLLGLLASWIGRRLGLGLPGPSPIQYPTQPIRSLPSSTPR